MQIATILALAALQTLGTAPATPAKVGTFNTRAVALAFYNSDFWAGVMKSKHAERNAAKAAGDTRKVEELEKWGSAHQDLAHKQVFGTAPIPNVLEHLTASLPVVAQKAGVDCVAGDILYVSPSTQKVDITLHLIEAMNPNDRTRALVKDFLKKNPLLTEPHQH